MTSRQYKLGIVIGLILAAGIPILTILIPFVFTASSVATGTATHDSLVLDLQIQERLHVFRNVAGIVGTLVAVPSWILLRKSRKEEELR